MAKLSAAQTYKLAVDAGFTAPMAVIMTAIAGAESGFRTDAKGDVGLQTDTWGPSLGLWQVRSLKAETGKGTTRDAAALTDPAGNAKAAFAVYKSQGLKAWSTYSSGAYRKFLSAAMDGRESSSSGTASGKTGADVLSVARKYLGIPYLLGGTDPKTGLDCSGYVQLVFKQLGITLPRTAREQSGAGKAVASIADAQPGDLLFFGPQVWGSDHIGIYAGDGQWIDAPRPGKNVRVEKLTETPTLIRRVIDGGPDASPSPSPPPTGSTGSGSAENSKFGLPSVPSPGDIAGAVGGAFGDALAPVLKVSTKLVFTGGGIVLVILGVFTLTRPAAQKAVSTGAMVAAPEAAPAIAAVEANAS